MRRKNSQNLQICLKKYGFVLYFFYKGVLMKIKEIRTNDYLTKSNLPASDYVVNPYVGCLHGCKYCYACFMKRFTGHNENWGEFLDVKLCDKPIDIKKLKGKTIFISSVTDCYNPVEKEYKLTRKILQQIKDADAEIDITTKSALVLRDIDIIKQMKNVKIAISINTLNEEFKNDMDQASSIAERLNALETLHKNGIYTVLFMSPIFPGLTEWKAIIEKTRDYVDEYWFENLNLRGSYKPVILDYIKNKYPDIYKFYDDIYVKNDRTYWAELAKQINDYCNKNKVKFKNYFYHEEIRKN